MRSCASIRAAVTRRLFPETPTCVRAKLANSAIISQTEHICSRIYVNSKIILTTK